MRLTDPPLDAALETALRENGFLLTRRLPTGEVAGIVRFVFTFGLCVGCDRYGYRTRFCYPEPGSAVVALLTWNGEGDPPGPWIKEKGRVERENPARFHGIPIVTETAAEPAPDAISSDPVL